MDLVAPEDCESGSGVGWGASSFISEAASAPLIPQAVARILGSFGNSMFLT
jgi:hypothetical protein